MCACVALCERAFVQGLQVRPELLIVHSRVEFTPLFTGHRHAGRLAECVELLLTALTFATLDDAEAMGSQYGDACSGGGADNGKKLIRSNMLQYHHIRLLEVYHHKLVLSAIP
jgi:hypothetical protein